MYPNNEKTPAATGVQDQQPLAKETDMNTVSPTPNTLPTKRRETLVLNRKPYTAEELDFAAKEGTLRLESRYVLEKRGRESAFRTPSGEQFRSAGSLYIRTCRDGVRRFCAYVHADSTHHDFRYLDEVINDARHGRMDGWKRHTFKDATEGWVFEYTNYAVDKLKIFKPAEVIIEEQSDSDTLVGFGSAWGYPCDEPRCREKLHDSEEGSHTLESLENAPTTRGSYEIEICKDMTKPDSDWYVNFWAAGDLSELTPEQIATLANDLQWMGLECATTNAKARKLRRDPAVTEELMERDQ